MSDSLKMGLNASAAIEFHLAAIKEYETRYLALAPVVALPFRFIGLYRLFNHPMVLPTSPTWLAQVIIEAEINRDRVKINTSAQLDEYQKWFIERMNEYNTGYCENGDVQRMVELGFNNIYDAWGFNDVED